MITVLGATGRIGEALVYRLLKESVPVRAVSRSFRRLEQMGRAGAIPAVADPMDTEKLTGIISGSTAVFTSVPFLPRVSDYRKFANALNMSVALAVQMSGVKRVVNLSSRGAQHAAGTGLIKTYYDAEQRLNTLPIPELIHLRIPFLMENLFGAIPVIEKWQALRAMIHPARQIPLIAAADVAEFAADCLLGCSVGGERAFEVPGSDSLTMETMAEILGEVLRIGRLPYQPFTAEEYRSWLHQTGISAAIIDLLAEMQESINSGRLYGDRPIPEADIPGRIRFNAFAKRFAPGGNA